jgi:hypothetical protein
MSDILYVVKTYRNQNSAFHFPRDVEKTILKRYSLDELKYHIALAAMAGLLSHNLIWQTGDQVEVQDLTDSALEPIEIDRSKLN